MRKNRHEGMLHVGRPNIGDLDLFRSLTEQILESRWFTNNGAVVRELEARLAGYLGVKHCIPVCNGTVGLQVACHALELSGEVILPAYTFIASAHALQWERIKPVFCEIDPTTHCIDAEKIEPLITERTSAILGVHIWGHPCETTRIDEIAAKYDLNVMYDAAHAFGCRHQGQMIGNFGACEVFSFHATKFFNTFEGGAIATNDDGLAEKIRLMINFGFSGMDNVIHLGTNGKMPEICAAMGLSCLKSLAQILAANRRNYDAYRDELVGIPGIRVYEYDHLEQSNYQYVVLEIDEQKLGWTRDQLFAELHENGIRARRYFFPGCHRMEPYVSLYKYQVNRLPLTDELCSRVLILPTGTAVEQEDVVRICELIKRHVVAPQAS